jgi:hypothetical protein
MKTTVIVLAAAALLCLGAAAQAGVWTTLDAPGATNTSARGIDGGNIVGNYKDSNGVHGFLYDGAGWTTLDHPSAANTYISDIDGSNVVGWYDDGVDNRHKHAFLYDGTTWTTLDKPGTSYTWALGISGNNILVGGGIGGGALYNTATATWTTLDPGFDGSWGAQGIDGTSIVGYYRHYIYAHGFLYDGTTIKGLSMPDADETHAYGVSGNIVVGYYVKNADAYAFFYDTATTFWTTLNPLGTRGVGQAYGVDGNNIVGAYNGRGFLYAASPSDFTIPEPASLLCVGLPALMLGLGRLKRQRR